MLRKGLDACKSRDTILNSGSIRVKITRYDTAHSGSTEGWNYEELRVTTNVWTREKHAIQYRTSLHVKNTRYDGAHIVGTEWGFGGKLLRNGKCKRVGIHDRMVHAVVAPSGVLAGN
ncbi:hypothetical protein B0H11DRAFT_1943252 [Mycena galericulata]|nr:hypothetical protein B0H11DRAFT_1943252 [Mycena galericulata]